MCASYQDLDNFTHIALTTDGVCRYAISLVNNKEAVGFMAQLSACSHPSELNPLES